MVIKINPSRIPIWRSPTTLQLGLGKNALVLQDLQPSDEKLVQLLYKGIADGSVGAVASTLGSSQQATGDLLNRLSPALLQGSEQASKNQALLSQEFVAQAFQRLFVPALGRMSTARRFFEIGRCAPLPYKLQTKLRWCSLWL